MRARISSPISRAMKVRSRFSSVKAATDPAAPAAASRGPPGWPGTGCARGCRGRARVRDARTRAPSRATKTRPTGFSGVPPSGPAMPVMPTPTSTPATRRAPAAIAAAISSETAPCRSRSACVHAQLLDLGGVAVGHERAIEEVAGPRHVGEARGEQAARAGLGQGQAEAALAQERRHHLGQLAPVLGEEAAGQERSHPRRELLEARLRLASAPTLRGRGAAPPGRAPTGSWCAGSRRSGRGAPELLHVALRHGRDLQHPPPEQLPPARSRTRGSTCSSNIGFISTGGPGSRKRSRPSSSTTGRAPCPAGSGRSDRALDDVGLLLVAPRPSGADTSRSGP